MLPQNEALVYGKFVLQQNSGQIEAIQQAKMVGDGHSTAEINMPIGTRDEAWLLRATSVRTVLAHLWRKLREDPTKIWKQAGHLEADIERLRAMLILYDTTE